MTSIVKQKSKILKRASKIMSIHEEVGYTPGHVVGHSDYEEAIRHMKHCIYLAVDEAKES
jgi:uncharacterized short protein YbdD (DUF466 family)